MVRTWILCGLAAVTAAAGYGQSTQWKPHDMNRPVPVAVDPGTASTEEKAGRPPADATVLFDGKDLSKWAA